jgi:hypothetical protein
MRRILALVKEAVFRIAFGIAILIQLLLWVLVWGGIASLLGSSNSLVLGSLIGITLLGPLFVGAANYFIYYRIVWEGYIPREAEKWLAARRMPAEYRKKHRRLIKRWALWIPVIVVVFFCASLDQTWPVLTHLLHPGYDRLGDYRISMPGWSIVFNDPPVGNDRGRSYVFADRMKGMLRAGFDTLVGRRLSMKASSMGCYATASLERDAPPWTLEKGQGRPRTYSTGGAVLDCAETDLQSRVSGEKSLKINCLTGAHDLSCQFTGDPADAADFYWIIQSVRKKN